MKNWKKTLKKTKKIKNKFGNTKVTCANRKKKYGSCFRLSDLIYMRKIWNKNHATDKKQLIRKKDVEEDGEVSYEKLWIQLKDRLNSADDFNWNLFFRDKNLDTIQKKRFLPFIPNEWKYNPTTWLSNLNIDEIMRYYTKKYPQFYYHFALGVDLERKEGNQCYYGNLCDFNLKDLIDNKQECFGVVLNTQSIDYSGEHWTAIFISLKRKEIIFYNSTTDTPKEEVQIFLKRKQDESAELYSEPFPIKYNTIVHQKSNTECGMFSVYFLIQMIKDIPFETFIKDPEINDKNMICLRGVLLNDVNNIYSHEKLQINCNKKKLERTIE